MIKVEHLYKSFDGKAVLKDISVDYEPGKCNMIIGASGSGKTVLLKNLIGLLEPDSGEICYGDRRLSQMDYNEKKALRQKIGVLFQGSALFDFATVIENVMFPMEFFTDWSEAQRRERAQYCLEKVNVIGSDDKYPNELSGGMQKRVGIARAIALNPEYLFCDEPNSGLDPYTSILIDRLIHDLTKEFNMTTIVNTHDMNSILEIGDRIGFISQGSLLWQGDRHTILKTECQELRDFVCANTLARNIIEGRYAGRSHPGYRFLPGSISQADRLSSTKKPHTGSHPYASCSLCRLRHNLPV